MPNQPPDATTARRIDDLCDQFEVAWRRGRRVSIEDSLANVESRSRRTLLHELLLLEWDILLDQGKPPLVGEYYRRFRAEQQVVREAYAEFNETVAVNSAAGLGEFVASLTEHNLVDPTVIHALSEGPKAEACRDVMALSTHLIENQYLTPYQARVAIQGRADELRLDQYILLDCVGRGGMGEVFLARHQETKHLVAIKLLYRFARRYPAALARFKREADITTSLSHPGFVKALSYRESRGMPFLVMEYIDGINLATAVEREGALRINRAIGFMLQAARAFEYAHSRGVVHRDIKPANLMVDRNEMVRILDLGVARPENALEPVPIRMRGDRRLTSEGSYLGTVEYMAPEQADDPRCADLRSDIYSLGCTLYYLLVGQPPFPAETQEAIVIAHQQAVVPSLRRQRPEISGALEELVWRMMAKEPDRRIQRMSDVATRLALLR